MNLHKVADKLIWHVGEFMAKIAKLTSGDPNRQAWCDGRTIGSGPWHCYCCQTVQAKLQGNFFTDNEPLNYHRIRCPVIGDQYGRKWQWPATKVVYLPNVVYRG